jgi:hypothetical protein
MKCEVCGLKYGLSHNCTGISPLVTPDEIAPAPGLRVAPLHYLEESFKILFWNDAAVQRAAKDNNSLVYGLLILAVGTTAPFQFTLLQSWTSGHPVRWNFIGMHFVQTLEYSLAFIVLQIGLSHALAKALFQAKGSYIELIRAYMLGQMFRCCVVIPIVGGMLVGIGGVAALMMVFEEVDGIERMKAFGLAATIGILFWIASVWITTNGPRPM